MAILIIEDDDKLAASLRRGLTEEGYVVERAADAESGLERLRGAPLEGCILDVRLPGMDGFTMLKQARKEGISVPVLMLTARDEVADRVQGLNLGADDYLVKPFAFAELVARLAAVIRRGKSPRTAKLVHGRITLDAEKRRVRVDDEEVTLSPAQFNLLELLLRRRGEVVARATLLDEVFGYKFDPGTNIVDVHIGHLRKKIDRAGRESLIVTVRGIGYRLGDGDA